MVGTTTLTVHRQLTPKQQLRRKRILDVALALAADGGYEAVQMKAVAARARVSLGTIYRDYASKDHLLAAALLEWGSLLGAKLRAWPPRGATPASRVASVFRKLAKGLEESPELSIALTTALLARDPSAMEAREGLTEMIGEWIDLALGEDEVEGRAEVVSILQHVSFALLVRLAAEERRPADVGRELERAAHRLLGRPTVRGRGDKG